MKHVKNKLFYQTWRKLVSVRWVVGLESVGCVFGESAAECEYAAMDGIL